MPEVQQVMRQCKGQSQRPQLASQPVRLLTDACAASVTMSLGTQAADGWATVRLAHGGTFEEGEHRGHVLGKRDRMVGWWESTGAHRGTGTLLFCHTGQVDRGSCKDNALAPKR